MLLSCKIIQLNLIDYNNAQYEQLKHVSDIILFGDKND